MSELHTWKFSLLIAAAFPCFAQAAEVSPVCLGKVCFRPALSLESSVLPIYGVGSVVRGGKAQIEDDRTRCYFDREINAYVLVTFWHAHIKKMRVSDLFLSSEALCSSALPPNQSFGALRLRAPIALGDSEALVLERLGPPQRKDDPVTLEAKNPTLVNLPGYGSRYGREKWVYFPEGEGSALGWSVHFQDGKVKSVGVWDSP